MDQFKSWLEKRAKKGKIINIPEGETTVRMFTYRNRKDIVGIVIPESLLVIGKGCFSGCKNLKEVNLPANLISVYRDAFANCPKLEKVTLSTLITFVSPQAFGGDKCNLKNIYISLDGKSVSLTASKDRELENSAIRLDYNIQNFTNSMDENYRKTLGIDFDDSLYEKYRQKDDSLDKHCEKINEESMER